MRKVTFQFGSEFDANERMDPWFDRAMDALSGATAAMAPARTERRSSFKARIAAISRAHHAG